MAPVPARASPAHLARSLRRAFAETPHQYLLTRRMERAAAPLRSTDHTVAAICLEAGLVSVGSFTTSFKRAFGATPTAYRAAHPLAAHRARIPSCVLMAWARPLGRAASKSPGRRQRLSSAPAADRTGGSRC